ncbi:LOW QUALITY PROTEIN: artemin [Cyclopterus lumpus]|uniref:LOW QUALITY PROTEIN: artemin n=1 Tax=Cyclopterus lumpus TaxID=8103 RepID=UPI001487018D|nr:LOW QUALITY PROTEIN: artemin [Cyclopterus lumpus]
MRSLMKLVVILVCVQRGEGRWLRSPIGKRGRPEAGDGVSKRGPEERRRGPRRRRPIPARSRRSAPDAPCGLRSVLLQVRHLGLGYDSDESVLFKYCGGSCPRVRSNHDLTLTNLLLSGVLPQPAPGELWHNAPCCRPTHHEDMAFLDNSHRWHKVEKLSAAGCGCVG